MFDDQTLKLIYLIIVILILIAIGYIMKKYIIVSKNLSGKKRRKRKRAVTK